MRITRSVLEGFALFTLWVLFMGATAWFYTVHAELFAKVALFIVSGVSFLGILVAGEAIQEKRL